MAPGPGSEGVSVWFTYLPTVNLLHFVQELVETGLHVVTLDLHHVQGGGGGGGEPAQGNVVELMRELFL